MSDEIEALARRLDDLMRYSLRGVWDAPAGWPAEPGRPALSFTRTHARLAELGRAAIPLLDDAMGRRGWSAIPRGLRQAMLDTPSRGYSVQTWRLPSAPVLCGPARSEHVVRWCLDRIGLLRSDEGLAASPRALRLSAPFAQLARSTAPTPLACLLAIEPSLSAGLRATLCWFLRERYAEALRPRVPAAASDAEVLAALTAMMVEFPDVDLANLEPWVVDHFVARGVLAAGHVGGRVPAVPPPPEALRGSRELSLLDLAERSGGRWDTADLGAQLGRFDAGLVQGFEDALAGLAGRGLVVLGTVRDAPGGWILTLEGHEVLANCRRNGWPLGPGELAAYLRQLEGDDPGAEAGPRARVTGSAHRARALQQACVVVPGCAAVAREIWRMARDPEPEVRRALFQGLAPPPAPDAGSDEWDVQGRGEMCLPAYAWDAILRAGLRDPSAPVREAAAALAFATERGTALAAELVSPRGAPEPGLRRWSALALGSAADRESRAALERLVAGEDPELAAAAVRALAARPDGRDAWRAALDSDRLMVRQAARVALEQIVDGLPADELDRLAARGGDVSMAVALYRSRVERRAKVAGRPTRQSVWAGIVR